MFQGTEEEIELKLINIVDDIIDQIKVCDYHEPDFFLIYFWFADGSNIYVSQESKDTKAFIVKELKRFISELRFPIITIARVEDKLSVRGVGDMSLEGESVGFSLIFDHDPNGIFIKVSDCRPYGENYKVFL